MSQRLKDTFANGRAEGRTLFMPYVTGGYPEQTDTVPLLLALEAGGADVIELGVPFTDPVADGATVQHANEVAVANGTTFRDCLRFVREAREQGLAAPVLLMGYLNPVMAYGIERAVADTAASGADGYIMVDMPPEEAGEFIAVCKEHDLSFVPLIAPTTGDDRIDSVAAAGDAFLYCVSVTGTTGQRDQLPAGLGEFIARVRAHSALPLAIGFGISRREHVQAVGRMADAAIVGSAIIAAIDAADPERRAERVREYVEGVTGH
jgi:tryptophan synthase alpha subunit